MRVTFLGTALSLAACAAPPGAVAPARGPEAAAVPVMVRDRVFEVAIGPGAPGERLTRGGAVSVPGASVRVTAPGLAQDMGLPAKEAARLACTGQGGRFQPEALGRFVLPASWVFDGACA